LRHTRWWLVWLTAASYTFYAWTQPYYLALVVYVTVVAYASARLMARAPAGETRLARFHDPLLKRIFAGAVAVAGTSTLFSLFGVAAARPLLLFLAGWSLVIAAGAFAGTRSGWFVAGLLQTIAPLLFFKYASFLVNNANALLAWAHVSWTLPDPATSMPFGLSYVLPLGISFYTLQALGYLIDCLRESVECERRPLRFASFVCFFPNVLMGPIERASHLLPQLERLPPLRVENVTDGLSLFLVGLFKKAALAGYLEGYVSRVYDNPAAFGGAELAAATFAYGWQLFFDFSGYSDMARGVARVMGFHLPLNFNHPYLATGLGDFWRRWHISLSRWILDYIFMPLQLRWREWRWLATGLALFVTFLTSGIWHGAAWTFVIWGALHGLGLAFTHGMERSRFYRRRVPDAVKRVWVLLFVNFAWIFFRAGSLGDAWVVVTRLFTTPWHLPQVPALMLALVVGVWLYQWVYESRFGAVLAATPVRMGFAVLMVLFLLMSSSGGGAFVYLQF
ncbi:MAG: MBOAT family O-acyltransferase, partial [Armatimonadota bacterium]|nr:MBOAT family O-acyltransferase [Armatimonadota bacterium]